MALRQNIIYIYFKGKHQVTSKSQYQYNRKQYLYFADLNLPQVFEVHFSNRDKGESKTQIGNDKLVEIPDEYFWNGALQIYAWIYLHSGVDDSETIYEIRIPLTKRAKPTDEEPLPVQQSAIDRAIAELNNAVNVTTENANKTESDKIIVANIKDEVVDLKEDIDSTAATINQKAQDAIDASGRAETSALNAADSERKALNYSQQAEQSTQEALESKNIAKQKAEIATGASTEALGYRDEAVNARDIAVQAKQNIVDYRDETKGYRDETLNLKNNVQTLKNQIDETAEEIEDISDSVKEDAQSASQSASSANQSSINASESASQAGQFADGAEQSANQAEQSMNMTEDYKNQSETFKNQAEEFKNQTETNVSHYPKIVNDYWYIWDATNREYVNTNVDANGIKGDTGNGIASIALNDDYTLTITFTDDTTYTTSSIRGQQGEKGDTGESGVYIGTEEPTDEDIKVWIDIDDDGTSEDLVKSIESLKKNIYKPYVVDSASGAIASFSDGADGIPLKSLIVDINPIQDLSHGDPSPENICPISGWTGANIQHDGANLFDNDTTKIHAVTHGTANEGEYATHYGYEIYLPAGTYTVKAERDPSLTASRYIYGGVYKKSGNHDLVTSANIWVNKTGYTRTITVAEDEYIIYFYGSSTASLQDAKTYFSYFDITMWLGTEVGDYAPYQGRTIPISWADEAGTVYGGKLDVLNGVMRVEMGMLDMSTASWILRDDTHRATTTAIKNLIKIPSSQSVKSGSMAENYTEVRASATITVGQFAVLQNGAVVLYYDGVNAPSGKLVYPLATPIEIQLDAHTLNSLYGQNNIWADTGDTMAEYRADTKLYIDKKIAEALASLT